MPHVVLALVASPVAQQSSPGQSSGPSHANDDDRHSPAPTQLAEPIPKSTQQTAGEVHVVVPHGTPSPIGGTSGMAAGTSRGTSGGAGTSRISAGVSGIAVSGIGAGVSIVVAGTSKPSGASKPGTSGSTKGASSPEGASSPASMGSFVSGDRFKAHPAGRIKHSTIARRSIPAW